MVMIFLEYWSLWAHLFRGIPNGDPYLAAFVFLLLMIGALKTVRSVIEGV